MNWWRGSCDIPPNRTTDVYVNTSYPVSVLSAHPLVVLAKVPMYPEPTILWTFLERSLIYYSALKANLSLP